MNALSNTKIGGVCHTDVLCGDLPDGAAPIAFYPRVLGHEGESLSALVAMPLLFANRR